jgi:MFS family permease
MSSLGLGILSPILPAYVDQFAATSMTLGMVFAAYSLSRTIFMPPVGWLSDRYGRKPFIVGGLLIYTAVSPLYTFAGSAIELGSVRLLQGLAAAMLMPVAMSYVGSLAPEGREGFIMGSFTSAFFMGLGFGPLIGGFLRDSYSMDAAFYGMGLLAAVALVLTSIILPSDRKILPEPSGREGERESEGKSSSTEPAVEVSPTHPIPPSPPQIKRRLPGLLFFRFCRATGIGFVWVLMPLYAVTELGITALQVGILLSVNTFLTTLLQSAFGYMSDKIGHLRTISTGAIIASAATAAISWCGNFEQLIIVSVFLGISGALIVPAGSALAVGIGRTRGMGRTMGLYNSSLSFGTLVGPIAGGLIMDRAGSFAVFPTAGVIGVVGLCVLLVAYSRNGSGDTGNGGTGEEALQP